MGDPTEILTTAASRFTGFVKKLVSPGGKAAYIETIMTQADLVLSHRIISPAA